MASLTIKDLDEADLRALALRAEQMGMSVQELLRRLVRREAERPLLPDELAQLARERRATRIPMTMRQFNQARARTARR